MGSSPTPDEQAFAVMKKALSLGANYWNGGMFYGTPDNNSLHLLNRYFTKYPEDADKVVINIKGGLKPGFKPATKPDDVREFIEECLQILDGKKFLDVFELARVIPGEPVEDALAVVEEYIKAGKIGQIGLSEVGANTIRKVAKLHKIASVEVEFSAFSTELLDNGVAEACAELNIPILAYSPLGRGFLTGQWKTVDDLPAEDRRRNFPRYSPENFEINLKLAKAFSDIATKKGCATSQLAIAWVRSYSSKQGVAQILPLPGTSSLSRLEENMTLVDITPEEKAEINEIIKKLPVVGNRYPGALNDLTWG
jgi:pyridoxine 4-dehydrogenase